MDTYLKIARLYLEDDDPVQAEAYINRASLLQNESSNEQLQIHYKVHHPLVISPLQAVSAGLLQLNLKLNIVATLL